MIELLHKTASNNTPNMTSKSASQAEYTAADLDEASLQWLDKYDAVSVTASICVNGDGHVEILFDFGDDEDRKAPSVASWALTKHKAEGFEVRDLIDIGLDTAWGNKTWGNKASGSSLIDKSLAALLSASQKASNSFRLASEKVAVSLSAGGSGSGKKKKMSKSAVENLKGLLRQRETARAVMNSIAGTEESLATKISAHLQQLYQDWMTGDPTQIYRESGQLHHLNLNQREIHLADALRSRVATDFRNKTTLLLLAEWNCSTDQDAIGDIEAQIHESVRSARHADKDFASLQRGAEDFAQEKGIKLIRPITTMTHPLMIQMDSIQHAMQGRMISQDQSGAESIQHDDDFRDAASVTTLGEEEDQLPAAETFVVEGLLQPHMRDCDVNFAVNNDAQEPSICAIVRAGDTADLHWTISPGGEEKITSLAETEPEQLVAMERRLLRTFADDIHKARETVHDALRTAASSGLELDVRKLADSIDLHDRLHGAFHSFNAAMGEIWTDKVKIFQEEETKRQGFVDEIKLQGGHDLERLTLTLATQESMMANPEPWARISTMTRMLEASGMDLLTKPLSDADENALVELQSDAQSSVNRSAVDNRQFWTQRKGAWQDDAFKSLADCLTVKELRDMVMSAMITAGTSGRDLAAEYHSKIPPEGEEA